MIPKYRAWDKTDKEMYLVDEINFNRGEFESIGDGITFLRLADEIELMQSSGMPAIYLKGLLNGYAWTGDEEIIGNVYQNRELLEADNDRD